MKFVLVFALFVCFFFVTLTAKTDILNAEAEGEMMRGSVLDGVLIRRETRDLDKQKNKNKNKKSKLKSKDKPDKVKKKNGKRSKRKLKKNQKEGKGKYKKQKGNKRGKRKKKKKGQKKKKSKDKRKKKRNKKNENKNKKLSAGDDPRSKRNTTCSTETVAATCLENAQTDLNYEKNQVKNTTQV